MFQQQDFRRNYLCFKQGLVTKVITSKTKCSAVNTCVNERHVATRFDVSKKSKDLAVLKTQTKLRFVCK